MLPAYALRYCAVQAIKLVGVAQVRFRILVNLICKYDKVASWIKLLWATCLGQALLLQLFGFLASFAVRPALRFAACATAAPSLRRLCRGLYCCAHAARFAVAPLLRALVIVLGALRSSACGRSPSFAFCVESFVLALLPCGLRGLVRFCLQLFLSVRACA